VNELLEAKLQQRLTQVRFRLGLRISDSFEGQDLLNESGKERELNLGGTIDT